ncbi:ninja-family protein AFP3 isoform X2 [Hevea brasiliensis]|uniref:ninja-family protein AFP3 isoform X2 n=1 Tax=Hevea brasiliensis TaxID=3981 RepID=UPI0025D36925|nr:ninja-family protein AFP3 isoform X2 [Hevea brasiliensis]
MAQAEKPLNTQNHHQQHQHMSLSNNFHKDFVQTFMPGNHFNHKVCEETEGEDVELRLGLSLNGRFGVDPKANKLTRSSSIPDFINPARDNGSAFMVNLVSNNLVRTWSLPTETDEEWRKRKELQMLRRMVQMEAKRKRSEKQRNLKALNDRNKGFGEESYEEDKRENGTISKNHKEQFVKNFNGLFGASAEGLLPRALVTVTSSQGSIGSQESGSSESESESQPVQGILLRNVNQHDHNFIALYVGEAFNFKLGQLVKALLFIRGKMADLKGTNKCNEARSLVSVQSLSECDQKLMATPKSTISKKSSSHDGVAVENSRCSEPTVENGAKEMVRNLMEDMPCVSTKGDGPNGKRIKGFLYRYKKGEEVRIVCVCHGSFLSPAEFVKHAGGGDVAHPLKHIVARLMPNK